MLCVSFPCIDECKLYVWEVKHKIQWEQNAFDTCFIVCVRVYGRMDVCESLCDFMFK